MPTPLFTVVFFTIANNGINLHAHEQEKAKKCFIKNKIIPSERKWMELNIIVLKDRSHSEEDKNSNFLDMSCKVKHVSRKESLKRKKCGKMEDNNRGNGSQMDQSMFCTRVKFS